MLKSIELDSETFGDRKEIELKPINVFCGANKSNKMWAISNLITQHIFSCDIIHNVTDSCLKPIGDESKKLKFEKTLSPKDNILQKEKLSLSFYDYMTDWLKYFDVDEKYISNLLNQHFNEFDLFSENNKYMYTGYGVGQIINIVGCSSLYNNNTLIYECPEVYLDPTNQMKMCDYILSQYYNGIQVIVKTYSDHIINRLVRRCLEATELIDNVSILYFKKNGEITDITSIPVDAHLGIDVAPEGFFDEYVKEIGIILDLGYKNIIKGSYFP